MKETNAMNDQLTIEEIITKLFREAPELIPRKFLSELIGGAISVKYLANLDSEGEGIKPRMRIGGRVAYPKDAAIKWFQQRCKIEGGQHDDQ